MPRFSEYENIRHGVYFNRAVSRLISQGFEKILQTYSWDVMTLYIKSSLQYTLF